MSSSFTSIKLFWGAYIDVHLYFQQHLTLIAYMQYVICYRHSLTLLVASSISSKEFVDPDKHSSSSSTGFCPSLSTRSSALVGKEDTLISALDSCFSRRFSTTTLCVSSLCDKGKLARVSWGDESLLFADDSS